MMTMKPMVIVMKPTNDQWKGNEAKKNNEMTNDDDVKVMTMKAKPNDQAK